MECKQPREDNEQSKKEYEDFVKQCIDNGQIKDIVHYREWLRGSQ